MRLGSVNLSANEGTPRVIVLVLVAGLVLEVLSDNLPARPAPPAVALEVCVDTCEFGVLSYTRDGCWCLDPYKAPTAAGVPHAGE